MRLPALGIALASLLILAQAPPPPGKVVRVPPDQAVAILGQPVAGPDGKPIGHLVDVLVDDTGQPEAGVIDFGGFMGVGARKIAVHWSTLHFAPGDAKEPITLDLTPDQIKAAPEYKNPAKSAPVVVATPAAPSGVALVAPAPSASKPAAPAPPSMAANPPAPEAPAAAPPAGPAAVSPTAQPSRVQPPASPAAPAAATPQPGSGSANSMPAAPTEAAPSAPPAPPGTH